MIMSPVTGMTAYVGERSRRRVYRQWRTDSVVLPWPDGMSALCSSRHELVEMYPSIPKRSSFWTPLSACGDVHRRNRVLPLLFRTPPSAHFQSPVRNNANSSSFNMSKDQKASAAAAQLLIDDEPDDWCVQWPRLNKRMELTMCAGTSESSVQAAQVCRTQWHE
jgi:hypothetical protein